MRRLFPLLGLLLVLPSCGGGQEPPIDPCELFPDLCDPSAAEPWVCGESEATGYIPKLQPLLDAGGRRQYMVTVDPASQEIGRLAPQGGIRASVQALAASSGVVGFAPMARGFSGILTHENALALAAKPGVIRVEEVGTKSIQPLAGPQIRDQHLDRLNQRTQPLDGNVDVFGTGEGWHIYVLDTGVNCGEIDGECGEGYSVFGGSFADGHGHGTFVAGEIADSFYGIAKRVVLHPVKVLSDSGSGSDLGVIEGYEWALRHAVENGWLNRSLTTASLGGNVSPTLDERVCSAVTGGQPAVVAAGNDGPLGTACDGSPARVDLAVTVGASDTDDRVADFSSGGICVDIIAVGVNVDSVNGRGWNGTSMATPLVAGALALYGGDVDAMMTAATPDVLSDLRGAPDLLVYVGPQ